MPFSRYQIRNEFSLADPELYKAADKEDPEALLEGVAMAGLVGVLRQLGDLAEFAAEIFHGLHEEVMVTAARGHSLLARVQQVESDFPSIERAFLSQTGHSAFFSSSGISWHPNLQMEQNLITKGDLPRFVMDSYEESRGPPRLFLLDKFDVAGAGACLKRYTDPSFYKVETSPYEMMNIETQRDKKIRKTKKKGSRMKNGEAPDVFQPSHVKLHQLLLEERVQNGASEPARRVKLKKREIKFPFDTETGKGYMEKLLNSPPEDKLVHEVRMVNSPPRLPTNNSSEPQHEPLEVKMVNSPFLSTYESPIVDKTVNREHTELQENGVDSEIEEIEEKQISVNTCQKDDVASDVAGDVASDVASETDNFMDALATIESEVETETEIRPNSDQTLKQIQSQDSDSGSVSDDENSPIKEKINNFSYSDTASSSDDDMSSQRGVNSQFASTEIPFRPRVSPHQSFDTTLLVDQETVSKEITSKESDLSEVLSTNCVDNIDNSNSTLLVSHADDEERIDDVLESNADVAEDRVSYSSENETELKDKETVSVDSDDDRNIDNNILTIEDEKEPEFLNSEIEDLIPVPVLDESKNLSTYEETESVEFSEESVISADSENIHINENETDVEKKESVILPELDSIPSASYDLENDLNENDKILQSETDFVDEKTDQNVPNEKPNSQFLDNVSDSLMSADFQESKSLKFIDQDVQESGSLKKDEHIDELEDEVDQTGDFESDPDFQDFKSLKKDEQIDELEEKVDQTVDFDSDPDFQESKSLKKEQIDEFEEKVDQTVDFESDSDLQESGSLKKDEQVDELEDEVDQTVDFQSDSDLQEHISLKKDEQIDKLEENVDQTLDFEPDPDFQESESLKKDELEEKVDQNVDSEFDPVDHLKQEDEFQDPVEPLMADLSNQINLSGFNILPQLPPINTEEMPPLPPLPPMQWRIGKLQNSNLISNGQPNVDQIQPVFPLIESQLSVTNDNSVHDHEDLFEEKNIPQPQFNLEKSENVSVSVPEIIRPISTSSLPLVDDEIPNAIRPMKIQRPRTPLIDAVAAHDKTKLRKVSERAIPTIPKEEEKDTLLDQIRAKSFNLKPAVQTRPSIQGPSTNLRVAAILEKANAIRQAFAGSDDDDDEDSDSWSDS